MSSGANNFRPTPGNRLIGRDYGAYNSNLNEPNRVYPMLLRTRSIQISEVRTGMLLDRLQSFEDRSITGPFGSASFLRHNLSPVPRQIMQDSPPPFTSQLNMQVPRLQEDPRLITKDEKKFRKEIYRHNSSLKRACLYYRDQATRDAMNKMEKERDEDGKRCPICLDDFESGQEVMLTPCNHMFHEDCIMPWVKSNSQCPVCRYAFSEQMRERASNLNNNNNIATDHLTTSELISVVRAMQEASLWGNGAR